MSELSQPNEQASASDSPCLLVSLSPCLRVFLVGYRCTGKTTVARLLAERLRWQWFDADAVLEERHGRSIREIFAEEGEASFREKESVILRELSQRQSCIIATGGGIVGHPENRACMRAAGYVIWLTADAATLWQRLQQDSTTAQRRPNLTVGGLAEIEELLRLRQPLYAACAHVQVSTEGRSPEMVAEAIEEYLHGALPGGERRTDPYTAT
jgi:shikimate kinase